CSYGKIHLGYHGYAGELGHTTIVPGGRTCGCGKQGCLEAYCAEKGIIETARTLLAESDKPSLMRDLLYIDPKEIYKCCEQGDELAIETFRRTGEYLGLGLANIAGIFDPEAIIITGGISNASNWLFDPTIEAFNKNLFRNLDGKIKILLSTMKDKDRDMLGASALAWEVKDYSLFV
ncbi:MAG: ROK family protein, partial [Prevotella sp.]|nr:ROK family protein [Prevotella sp.]MBO5204992.1 ROK family protein [Prevotella sp.]